MWIARTGISASANSVVPSDMELIDSYTVAGAAQSSITLAVPTGYKHLELRYTLRFDGASSIHDAWMRVNGDSSTNYVGYHYLYGSTASGVGAGGYQPYNFAALTGYMTGAGSPTSVFGSGITYITDYSSTSKTKVIRSYGGSSQNTTAGAQALFSSMWLSTNAITSLTVLHNGSASMVAGSTVALYGVK